MSISHCRGCFAVLANIAVFNICSYGATWDRLKRVVGGGRGS